MQFLPYTAGKMTVHIGIVPGGDQENFLQHRLRTLKPQHARDVIVMHIPDAQHDDSLHCTFWPGREGLWDFAVLKKVLACKPRLLILPKLSLPRLHEAEHAQYLENIAAVLAAGATVETSLAILEVARVDDMLSPPVNWPKHAALTGNFLRKFVGDYQVHDSQPQEIMARYYSGDIKASEPLAETPTALFNNANLVRLREAMLRFVNSHLMDVARKTNPDVIDLKPNTTLGVKAAVLQTIYALAGNAAVVALAYEMFVYLEVPLVTVGFLLLAAPMVTALYVNPITTVISVLFTFAAFNQVFYGSSIVDIASTPGQFAISAGFLGVSLIVSYLINRNHIQQQHNFEQTLLLKALLRLTYDLSNSENHDAAIEASIANLQRTLNLESIVLEADGTLWSDPPGGVTLSEAERAAAQTSMDNGHMVTPDDNSPWLWCPLQMRRTVLGAIGIKLPHEAEGTPSFGTVNLLRAYSDLMCIALRRIQLREAADGASQEAEREGLRAALLSAVSHDLKTPLVSIIGSLSTLIQVGKGLPEADKTELLTTAHEEAERLHSIIHNVLELTKLESGHVQPKIVAVDIEAMITGLLERCKRYYPKMRIAVTTPPPLPWVEADPLLLEEVLYNLVDNAGKYAGDKHPLELSAEVNRDVVEIRLADRGPGIPEDEREKVFDKYFRSSQKDNRTAGSGLGLAISRAIIEACHGKIWVEGRPDKKQGTVMVLQLGYADTPVNHEVEQEEES